MIKAYGNRKVYFIFSKKDTSSIEALHQASQLMHFHPRKLKVSCADLESETKDEMTFLVERSKGAYWCVSRKGKA